MYDELLKRAEVKSGMLMMGEKIAFGSDASIIDELSAAICDLTAKLEALKSRPLAEIQGDAVINWQGNWFVCRKGENGLWQSAFNGNPWSATDTAVSLSALTSLEKT